jgi:hypothetical protein
LVPFPVSAGPANETAVRLLANRDEQRTRPPAMMPQVRRFGNQRAILPIDPVSQGTWIAVSDAGLAMTVLNVNPGRPRPPTTARASRGAIIPALLSSSSLEAALDRATTLPAADYAPFRLILTNAQECVEIQGDGDRLCRIRRGILIRPMLSTSSGLGDHCVEGPRRKLFEMLFRNPREWLAAQDALHRHSWPDQPHLSVCMRRPDAQTVSQTAVEIHPDRVTLTYAPGPPDLPTKPISLSLELYQPSGAA